MQQTMRYGDWYQLIVSNNWEGKTIEQIFRDDWKVSKKMIHSFRTDKKVQVNGKEYNWNVPLSARSKLQLRLFEEEEIQIAPHFQEIKVLYEDDHLVVLNKPPFMKTHPNDPTDTDTLVNAAQFHMLANGEVRNIRQIHRLDRDTSGAILFAKHALAGAILDRMLVERKIKRTYLALAQGIFQKKKGTIDAPIGRDRHHPSKRRISHSGQAAVTHYHVIKEDKHNHLSYVKCSLETGRTHQIRVHLKSIGHPLAGDILYDGNPIFNRQALHAVKLEFIHPFTQEEMKCLAPFLDNPVIFKNIDLDTL